MNEAKLGKLCDQSEQRDAVHVAIIPMMATKKMKPGECVGNLGIVDPWLEDDVRKGQWFWLCLRPGSITSLRHDWQHPAFPVETYSPNVDAGKVAAARKWITVLAKRIGPPFDTFDDLMAHVEACAAGGEHYVEQGSEQMRDVWYEAEKEFWPHYETLTGKTKPSEYTPVFCCSC